MWTVMWCVYNGGDLFNNAILKIVELINVHGWHEAVYIDVKWKQVRTVKISNISRKGTIYYV